MSASREMHHILDVLWDQMMALRAPTIRFTLSCAQGLTAETPGLEEAQEEMEEAFEHLRRRV